MRHVDDRLERQPQDSVVSRAMRCSRDAVGPLVLMLVAIGMTGLVVDRAVKPESRASAASAALFEAARLGHVSEIERAISSGMSIDAVESGSRMTPLMWAAQGGHREAAQWLLDHGANVHLQAGGYGTPLAIAASTPDNSPMVRLLLEYGADPNLCTIDGNSPLMRACNADPAAARLLIRAGADVNACDRWGRTPVQIAVDRGDADLVRRLIQAGANSRSKVTAASAMPKKF